MVPRSFYWAIALRGYSFRNQAGQFPTLIGFFSVWKLIHKVLKYIVCFNNFLNLFNTIVYEGRPPKTDLQKIVFILTCLNFSHLQSTCHLMQCIYQDFFPTTQNSFWTLGFWCLLVLLPFFVSSLHVGKMFLFEGFFNLGKQQKFSRDEIRWLGRVGHGASCRGQKLLNTQSSVGRCAHKSPIMI